MSAIESVAGSFAGQSAYGLSHNHNIKAAQENQLQKKQDIKLRTNQDAVNQDQQKTEIANTRDKKDIRLRHVNSQTIKADSDHKVFDNPAYAQKASGPMPGKPLFSANNMLTLLQFQDNKSVKIDTERSVQDNKRIAVGVEQDKLRGKRDTKAAQAEFIAHKKLYEDTAAPKPEDLKPQINVPGVEVSKNDPSSKIGERPEVTNKLRDARATLNELKSDNEQNDINLSKSLNKVADRAKQNQSLNLTIEQEAQYQDQQNANLETKKIEQSFKSDTIGF
ncbi:hypothetical protein [Pseudemcibacter aquimaris]|uniref:hypothetical protein n=1 Tax=Pseudemcibacter aquimaris TaxID=2857064 RepID=UPI0020130DEB|nr:hypothetical protein [Pseudemcibacter aquimaris]MCC3861579.1 hypothetical protein [Pseudemcibacter aquimaris]WDU58348.1 hypothetical protein KW060_14240 [Pseudemcibacter aquimaris]